MLQCNSLELEAPMYFVIGLSFLSGPVLNLHISDEVWKLGDLSGNK